MTNEEIWKLQQEHRAHLAAVPGALGEAKAVLTEDGAQVVVLFAASVRTLVREIERLQAALKRANDDLRDEQREAQYAAGAARSEGYSEGLQEGRGW